MPLDSRIDIRPDVRPATPALPGDSADQVVSQAVIDLVLRLDALVPATTGRVTEFIGPSGGEGVSTIAWSFAEVAATLYGRRVLVLGVAPEVVGDTRSRGRPLFEALRAGDDIDPLIAEVGHNLFAAALVPLGSSRRRTAADLTDGMAWRKLRSRFDEIVLDVPSAARSRLGLVCAPFADGVLVVLEAERTRAPVAERLIANLRALRANVVGTVLNKRRFYVPDAVYRRL